MINSNKKITPYNINVLPTKKEYFLYVAILLICYTIALLAAWPGFFCYDAERECYEVFTYRYANHHPFIHELLLADTLRLGHLILGSYNAGITMYCVAQMIVLSFIFAYMILTMREYHLPFWAGITTSLFMGLFPPIAMFSVCTAKDGLFCGGMVLMATLLYRFIKNSDVVKSAKYYIFLVFSALLILFFRNNGLYVLALFSAILLVFTIKDKKNRRAFRNIFICITFSTVFYYAVIETLIAVVPVERGETREMLSVPIQQLAIVHSEKRETYSDEDLEILYTLIPEIVLERYNPKVADPVKVNFLEDNFKADPQKYISLWFRTFLKQPGLYFKAFAKLTEGYWNPFTVISGYEGIKINETVYGECAYFQYTVEVPGEAKPILKGLNSLYREISLNADVHRLPVIGFILAPATWVWLFLIFFVLCIFKGGVKASLPYLVTTFTFLTVLLGPSSLVRYVLYMLLLLPLIIFDIVTRFKTGKSPQ